METEEVGAHWEANAEIWTRLSRAGYDVYRDRLNTPAFLAMLPPVRGLTGLDIGCGEGTNTRHVARLGAKMHAIDIAPTFIAHAQAAETADPLGIDFRVGDAAALEFPDRSFDFATAFMSLMDMPDHDRALAETHRVLKPGGFLQFSILHPCFVPPRRKTLRNEDGTVRGIEVSDYFRTTDGEVEEWWFSKMPKEQRAHIAPFRVPRFHRTLSAWIEIITAADLMIEQMGEPCASEAEARRDPILADTRIAPIFLHVRARKPSRQG